VKAAGRVGIAESKESKRTLPSLMEVGVAVFLVLQIAPRTWLAYPFQVLVERFTDGLIALGFQQVASRLGYEGFLYVLGYALFVWLLLLWAAARSVFRLWALPVDRLMVAVVLLGLVYASDWLLSTQEPYNYASVWWLPYGFALFLAIVLLQAEQATQRLAIVLAVAIGIQALYGVAYYWMGIEQFHTPNFGQRTGGTLRNPNPFYPVVLMGFWLAVGLGAGTRGWLRVFWLMLAFACFVGLWFTYTRAGWLALALTLPLITLGRWALVESRGAKVALYGLAAALIVATMLVRTGGELMGNPEDRSFWGRIAIWQTALRVWWDYPLIGGGVGTYAARQHAHLSDTLRKYNPMNTEPKNLFLHWLCELGIVGLLMGLLVLIRAAGLWRQVVNRLQHGTSTHALMVGMGLALLALLLTGLMDTPVLEYGRWASTLVAFSLLALGCRLANTAFPCDAPSEGEIRQRERRFFGRLGLLVIAGVGVGLGLWQLVAYQVARYRPQLAALCFQNPPVTHFTPLKQVPPELLDAVVASEDGYFWVHNGVDWGALHRALRVNLRHLRFKQGGSTITMQTARYLLTGRQRTLLRKAVEVALALEMERILSKERILELYLNSAKWGIGAYDIASATKYYFGKAPNQLTLSEATFLAGVLPEPPATCAELTPEKVRRCQMRAFRRLVAFFPFRYQHATIQPPRFRWEVRDESQRVHAR
jgi:O-antigen ligase